MSKPIIGKKYLIDDVIIEEAEVIAIHNRSGAVKVRQRSLEFWIKKENWNTVNLGEMDEE